MQVHNQLLIHTYSVGDVVKNDHIHFCKIVVSGSCC